MLCGSEANPCNGPCSFVWASPILLGHQGSRNCRCDEGRLCFRPNAVEIAEFDFALGYDLLPSRLVCTVWSLGPRRPPVTLSSLFVFHSGHSMWEQSLFEGWTCRGPCGCYKVANGAVVDGLDGVWRFHCTRGSRASWIPKRWGHISEFLFTTLKIRWPNYQWLMKPNTFF